MTEVAAVALELALELATGWKGHQVGGSSAGSATYAYSGGGVYIPRRLSSAVDGGWGCRSSAVPGECSAE